MTEPEVPTSIQYAEDLEQGMSIELGSYTVSHDEIVAFAGHWDPQPFHIDDDSAARGHFGEVIASGLHTMAVFQRLAVLGAYRNWAIIAGRSIRDIQFTSPVRPGMTLHGTLLVSDVSFTRPGRALVTKLGTLRSGGTVVMTAELAAYVRSRRRR